MTLGARYYVMKCTHCGRHSSTQPRDLREYTFLCKYCGKHVKVKQSRYFGLSVEVKGPYTSRDVVLACIKLNGGRI